MLGVKTLIGLLFFHSQLLFLVTKNKKCSQPNMLTVNIKKIDKFGLLCKTHIKHLIFIFSFNFRELEKNPNILHNIMS